MIDYAYDDAAQAVFSKVGGRLHTPRTHGYRTVPDEWSFGWVPMGDRTAFEESISQKILADMPRFEISGNVKFAGEKSCLWELWKHPKVVEALGVAYSGIHQLTGSCVGAGGGNACSTLAFMEILRLGDPEQLTIPFWLYPYGKSRNRAGMRGRGEGSTGTAFAEAVRMDGLVDANDTTLGLPPLKNDDGLVYGQAAEMQWSDGAAAPSNVVEAAKKHLVQTTAECRNADDVKAAIINCYPVTCASSWGGMMECQVQDGVLMNRRTGTWNHQQSILAWWDHPKHGEIFWVQNQWGLTCHGSDPAGGPGGGYWVKKEEVEWMCNNGEVIVLSQFQGFPARELSWLI